MGLKIEDDNEALDFGRTTAAADGQEWTETATQKRINFDFDDDARDVPICRRWKRHRRGKLK